MKSQNKISGFDMNWWLKYCISL